MIFEEIEKRIFNESSIISLSSILIRSHYNLFQLIPDAIEYAKELSGKCTLYHSQGDFGENLFLSVDHDVDFLNSKTDFGAINAFYAEISCYCGYETECPPCVYGQYPHTS